MGMSASQARLLNLEGRQSNLEYQGQQINQERSVLSQQCTALYNSLLTMTVPTPPSTSDFTKVEYKGVDGATTFKLGNIKPQGESFSVELKQESVGIALAKNHGTSRAVNAGTEMTGSYIEGTIQKPTGNYTQVKDDTKYQEGDFYVSENFETGENLSSANVNEYLENDNGVFKPVKEFKAGKNYVKKLDNKKYDAMTAEEKKNYSHVRPEKESAGIEVKAEDLTNFFIIVGGKPQQLSVNSDLVKQLPNGNYELPATGSNVKLFKKGDGNEKLTNPNTGKLTIAGNDAMTFDEAKSLYGSEFEWESYEDAIRNTFGASDQNIDKNSFYVFVKTSPTGARSLEFALKTDADSPDGFTETYSFSSNTKYNTSNTFEGCKLNFDENGMITQISIPKIDKATQEIIGYDNIDLAAEKVTDEKAYQDAYAKYEYETYEYDKKNQEINAKTEIIQQQDRNLELKLQRLDNERTQIKTEIEAVKKVINDNIEGSYKSFSG